jgi:arabinofuranan 3-O-arabinosyltransferase
MMTTKAVHRFRVLAVCSVLTGLAFRQDPGFTSPDTKIDLTVDPVGLLSRSLQLWDPSGNFGQLQNQAYGYLWPMGPFHALGQLAGMPGWVVQRLWWALLLCVAFTGVVRLAGKLGIGTPGSRLIGGLAFALSVRTLTELGGISVEAWPTAIAPWVLVPLAGLAPGASLRKPIAWSALAVACAGGVNATAVFAVVPLALLWLFTVESTRQRFFAVVGWCFAVALATAWWILPLLVLGRYSPPFLNFIETASVTTQVTDVQSMLRGASHWQAYYRDIYGAVWPAGRRLATEQMLIWASTLAAALGLAGLARRGMPHRRFLITGLLLGLAMVGFGHVAATAGAFPEWQRALLDGPAVAFRNVHKFDLVIRLPLALGLVHLTGVFFAAAQQRLKNDRARFRALAVGGTAVLAVAGISVPALAGGLTARGEYVTIPGHWWLAADWLGKRLEGERVLVVPGARFGDYRWGSTTDEVIQSLLDGQWAVRNAIPLTPPGTIRFLDSIEQALATGAGSPGLADVLARAGVKYVMLRADIDYGKSGTIAPSITRESLTRSPGLAPVIAFGEVIGEPTEDFFQDRGLGGPMRPLEIFEVQRAISRAAVHDLAAVSTLVGGPESLLPLATTGLLPEGPTVLAGDLPEGFRTGKATLTDGLRRREVNFGLGRDNASATLDAKQPMRGNGVAPDYLPAWAGDWFTVAAYTGISGINASESWGDMQGLIGNRPAHHPFAAIDGDPSTSWRTPPNRPVEKQWIEVRFPGPQQLSEITIAFDPGASWLPTRFTVDTGVEQVSLEEFTENAVVKLSGIATSRLRIYINSAVERLGGEGGIGISEIKIAGLDAKRHLAVPSAPAGPAVSQVLFSNSPVSPACYALVNGTMCDPERVRASEDSGTIARSFSLRSAGRYEPALWARPRPGPALDAALAQSTTHTAAASTSLSAEPGAAPASVIDGDPETAWRPSAADEHPWLRLNWTGERSITAVSVTLGNSVAASRPWGVQIVGDSGIRTGVVDGNGVINFSEPMLTDDITVFFLGSLPVYSRNPYLNENEQLPIAVGELDVFPTEGRSRPDPGEVITLPCGSGPDLQIGGRTWESAIEATRGDLAALREVPAVLCGQDGIPEAELGTGSHTLLATASELAIPVRAALVAPAGAVATAPGSLQVLSWGTSERKLRLPAHSSARVLNVPENTNPGWEATIGGVKLVPLVVDGWQQGWIVPAGAGGEVLLSFAPEETFQWALLIGAGGLLLVLLAAVLPGNNRAARVAGRHRFRREGLYLFGGLALISVGGLAGVLMAVTGVLLFFVVRRQFGRVPKSDQRRLARAARRWLWLLPPALFVAGAWLASGAEDRHSAIWPQLTGLGAVVLLWLSAYWPRRGGPRPAPVDGWLLDQIPADRGGHDRAGHGQQIHADGLAAEGRHP